MIDNDAICDREWRSRMIDHAIRLSWPIALLLGLCILSFFLGHVAPGDPARIILGPTAPEEAVEVLREEMGFNRTLASRFVSFLGQTLSGRWGTSWLTRQPVLREIGEHLRPTLYLGVFASFYSIITALAVNAMAFAAPRLGRLLFPVLRLGIAVPSFVVSVAAILVLTGIHSRVSSIMVMTGQSPWVHAVPAMAVALYPACVMSAILRDRFNEIAGESYFRAARAFGYPNRQLFLRVLLPNGWDTLLAAWVNQISLLVFSTIIVEYVFSFRGLGSLLIRSIQGKDLPVVTGIILLNGIFFLLVHYLSQFFLPRVYKEVSGTMALPSKENPPIAKAA